MKHGLEILTFVAIALAVHVLAFAENSSSGQQSGGSGGEARLSITAAATTVTEMVQNWERPPDTLSEVQTALTAPDLPSATETVVPQIDLAPTPRPEARLAAMPADTLDEIDLNAMQPPPPPPEPEPEVSQDPPPKPKPRPPQPELAQKADQSSAGRQKEVAAGAGGTSQAGMGRAETATGTPGQNAELAALWGAKIRARIDRNKRYPRGTRASGDVTVELRVARDGRLLSHRIRTSSGVPILDDAALTAVARAGRFPNAPKKLAGASFGFSVRITLMPR